MTAVAPPGLFEMVNLVNHAVGEKGGNVDEVEGKRMWWVLHESP